MSKHSKWAKVKHQKGGVDAKRAAIFTKLARVVTVAAREGGGDPNFNFRLRTAIDQALAANMPKDNIDRAIKRGIGETEGARIEEAIYEGYGPGGTAILVAALTDNRNRTSSSLKHIFSSRGGNLATSGAVMWMFEKKGVIRLDGVPALAEDAELQLIDAGADDIQVEDDGLTIRTPVDALIKVRAILESAGLKPSYSGFEWLPKERPLPPAEDIRSRLEELVEALDDDEDVDSVYTNVDL